MPAPKCSALGSNVQDRNPESYLLTASFVYEASAQFVVGLSRAYNKLYFRRFIFAYAQIRISGYWLRKTAPCIRMCIRTSNGDTCVHVCVQRDYSMTVTINVGIVNPFQSARRIAVAYANQHCVCIIHTRFELGCIWRIGRLSVGPRSRRFSIWQ
jgi:hypothetical protein